MNTYLVSVIENVKKKYAHEPEFVQTVEEVFTSLEPVIDKHPEYEKVDLLGRMVEPVSAGRTIRASGTPTPAGGASSTAPWAPTRAACGSRPTGTRASSNSWGSSRSSRTA